MINPKDEVKSKVDIVDLISSYIPVKKAGTIFKARCPFHNEKTPSFTVSPSRQTWHCFGCDKGGDVFAFLMEKEGFEFAEALKLLADKVGVQLPQWSPHERTERLNLTEILEVAQEFFIKQLHSPAGEKCRAYLENRGLHGQILADFGIGYASAEWDTLLKALRTKFKEADIARAGLAIERAGGRYYDRFRDRLMIPLRNLHGSPVGFTGRILEGQWASKEASPSHDEAKYMNTPETPVFKKGNLLFALDRAKDSMRHLDHAILVEGNLDVITCHEAGYTNVIAPCGTALTIEQLNLIKRFTNRVKFAFDADTAGQKAIVRAVELGREAKMQMKIITIPEGGGKDPDECIRKTPELWKTALKDARDAMDYFFEQALQVADTKTPAGRGRLSTALMPEIALLPTMVEQDYWLTKLAGVLQTDPKLLWEELRRLPKKSESGTKNTPRPPEKPTTQKEKSTAFLEQIFAISLDTPALLPDVIAAIDPKHIDHDGYRTLCEALMVWYSQGDTHEARDVRSWLLSFGGDTPVQLYDALTILGEATWGTMSEADKRTDLMKTIELWRAESIQRRLERLARDMTAAETRRDTAHIEALAREFQAVREEEALLKSHAKQKESKKTSTA